MARRDEQPPLWATVPAEELCQTFEDAREGWRVVRFRHVIGRQGCDLSQLKGGNTYKPWKISRLSCINDGHGLALHDTSIAFNVGGFVGEGALP